MDMQNWFTRSWLSADEGGETYVVVEILESDQYGSHMYRGTLEVFRNKNMTFSVRNHDHGGGLIKVSPDLTEAYSPYTSREMNDYPAQLALYAVRASASRLIPEARDIRVSFIDGDCEWVELDRNYFVEVITPMFPEAPKEILDAIKELSSIVTASMWGHRMVELENFLGLRINRV